MRFLRSPIFFVNPRRMNPMETLLTTLFINLQIIYQNPKCPSPSPTFALLTAEPIVRSEFPSKEICT